MQWQYTDLIENVKTSANDVIIIQKQLLIKNDSNEFITIDEKTAIKLGDKITVQLIIEAKQDLEFMHLKDLRAAGLEPKDVLSSYKN